MAAAESSRGTTPGKPPHPHPQLSGLIGESNKGRCFTQSHSRQSHTERGPVCRILLTPRPEPAPYLSVLLHQGPQVKHIDPTVLGYL